MSLPDRTLCWVEGPPWDRTCVPVHDLHDTPMGEFLTPILSAKLDAMQLHDDTGDPHDEGYMAAVAELREWMHGGDAE